MEAFKIIGITRMEVQKIIPWDITYLWGVLCATRKRYNFKLSARFSACKP